MSYIDPCTVISPKKRIEDLRIVYDSGPTEVSWAVAEFIWDSKERVGIRWNGEPDDDGVGTPQARGVPTWFVLPVELAPQVLHRARELASGNEALLTASYREMASDREREAEAEEWTEGLIGDASTQG
jgi:hypothetical protein